MLLPFHLHLMHILQIFPCSFLIGSLLETVYPRASPPPGRKSDRRSTRPPRTLSSTPSPALVRAQPEPEPQPVAQPESQTELMHEPYISDRAHARASRLFQSSSYLHYIIKFQYIYNPNPAGNSPTGSIYACCWLSRLVEIQYSIYTNGFLYVFKPF